MISRDEFVEASIAHQLGDLSNVCLSTNLSAMNYAKSASSGMTVSWDHHRNTPDGHNGWLMADRRLRKTGNKVNRAKVAGALGQILERSPSYDFLVDMADHRARNLVMENGHCAPVFCFNRKIGAHSGRILWPLPEYQDLGSDEFLGGTELRNIPWAQKSPNVVWRGTAGNWGRLGKYGRGRPIRLYALLKKHKSGQFTLEETQRTMMTMERQRFLFERYDDPRFDIGYTNFGDYDLDAEPLLQPFRKSRMARADQCAFKYLAVLPGSDVGSNFYWVMNSSSLGLVMEHEFESFASAHFKPWVHFVPFKKDLSDLNERLAWCDANQDACQKMIKRANAVCDLLADGTLRAEILDKIVSTVGAHILHGNANQVVEK